MKIIVAMFCMLVSFRGYAHALDMGYLEINYSPETKIIKLNMDVHPIAVKNKLDLRQLLSLNQCKWISVKSEVVSFDKLRLSGEAHCPSFEEKININIISFDNFPADYQIVGRLLVDNKETTFLMNNDSLTFAINASEQKTFFNFIMMGIEHIGVTPAQWHNKLPEGIDHILFVLALILLGGGLRNTIKIVSGFTLGHSISLALAGLNLINIPGSVIEPMIALSIVYVAVEALILKKSSHRWMIASFFGIVHGFGFATALRDLHLTGGKLITALIGFNLGVESGQVIIILVALPLLHLLSRRPLAFQFASKMASLMIAVVGSYWFVVRIFS